MTGDSYERKGSPIATNGVLSEQPVVLSLQKNLAGEEGRYSGGL